MLYERVLERNDIQTVDICNLEIFAMYCSQELVKVSIKCNEWLNSWGSGQVDQYDSNQHIIRDILEWAKICIYQCIAYFHVYDYTGRKEAK